MIKQLSRDTKLPILESNHERASNDYNNPVNRIAEAIAGIASQQRLTTSAILKPESTNAILFDGKKEIGTI